MPPSPKRSEAQARSTSLPIPIVVVSGRRLIVARLRTGNAIPINPGETRMPIDKTQDILRGGIRSGNGGMPRTSEKRRPLGGEYGLGRILDGTKRLACNPRHRVRIGLVAVEGVAREDVVELGANRSIGWTDIDFIV